MALQQNSPSKKWTTSVQWMAHFPLIDVKWGNLELKLDFGTCYSGKFCLKFETSVCVGGPPVYSKSQQMWLDFTYVSQAHMQLINYKNWQVRVTWTLLVCACSNCFTTQISWKYKFELPLNIRLFICHYSSSLCMPKALEACSVCSYLSVKFACKQQQTISCNYLQLSHTSTKLSQQVQQAYLTSVDANLMCRRQFVRSLESSDKLNLHSFDCVGIKPYKAAVRDLQPMVRKCMHQCTFQYHPTKVGNYKTWTPDWTMDWTRLWTRSLTAKKNMELSQTTLLITALYETGRKEQSSPTFDLQ